MGWLRLGFVVTATVVMAATILQAQKTVSAKTSPKAKLQAAQGYKGWTRLNAQPYHASPTVSALCRSLTPKEQHVLDSDPHKEAWITVYANPKAAHSIKNHDKWVFPEGSVLVKEKRNKPDAKEPDLKTVMVKRAPGYFPKGGDWEYAVLDAKDHVQADGKIVLCASCHANYAQTGYAALDYLDKY